MAIDLNKLNQETRDIIEMREQTDQTFWRFSEYDYSDIFWNTVYERADPEYEHSLLISLVGTQGSGKSMAAITLCSALDPNFTIENIFFGYDELVHNRHKLQPNSAVLIDEQSQSYGIDSHRVMLILSSLKEQLRKKSIHFIFCAPVLYEESKSSMYIIETMFIDYQTSECYAALKTRDGLTLGHVRIPYPLKLLEDGRAFQTKSFIEAYQAKKDKHLESVLGKGGLDVFEERAIAVINHQMFQQAEKLYVAKMGYIPQSTLIQLISKMFPEYKGGIAAVEVAGRVKLNRELSGKWGIAGATKGKKSAPAKKSVKPVRKQ